MTHFPIVVAAERWIAAAATQPAKPPVDQTTTLLRNALHLLDQWSTRFGAQVPVGYLPGATMATMERIGAVVGTGKR